MAMRELRCGQILRDWALNLSSKWERKVEFGVIDRVVESVFISSLELNPFGRPNSKYELIRIRSLDGSAPCSMDCIHLGESGRAIRVDTIDLLESQIKQVIKDERSEHIFQVYAEEATTDAKNDGTPLQYFIGQQMFRTQDGKLFVTVSLAGVSGFLSESELQFLSSQPNEPRSAFKYVSDNRIAVTVEFTGPTKFMLSAESARALQKDAKEALASRDQV